MTSTEFLAARCRIVTVIQAEHTPRDIIGKGITLNMQTVMWAHAVASPGEFQICLVSGDHLWVRTIADEREHT